MLGVVILVVLLITLPWTCAMIGGHFTSMDSQFVLDVPALHSYVTDFSGTLSKGDKLYLENLCKNLERRTSTELAVVIVKHMSSDGKSNNKYRYPSVELYAAELFRQNGIGKKGKNTGVLFLVSVGERKTRIEVGYGLEGVLNDGKCGRILDDNAVPYFNKNDFSFGVRKTVEAIFSELDKDFTVASAVPKDVVHSPPVSASSEIAKSTDSSFMHTEAEPYEKTASPSAGYYKNLLIALFAICFLFLPFIFLVLLFVIMLILGSYFQSSGIFAASPTFSTCYLYIFLGVAYAFLIRCRVFGGSSGSGGGFGGGSSGGGGASRSF